LARKVVELMLQRAFFPEPGCGGGDDRSHDDRIRHANAQGNAVHQLGQSDSVSLALNQGANAKNAHA
jgi:hypothetical protein